MRRDGMAMMGHAPTGAEGPLALSADEGRGANRKRPLLLAALALLCVVLAAACATLAWNATAKGDTGSYIIPKNGMSDQEAQAMIDGQTESSRITVSLSPSMRLSQDGSLRVNFMVEEPNNDFSERLEVEQDGVVVYASGAVAPGRGIEWCQAPSAHEGPAVATVYAVDGDGFDRGNPVSVEVEITAA